MTTNQSPPNQAGDTAGNPPATVASLFATRAQRFPERVFLSVLRGNEVEAITYDTAARRVAGMVRWLHAAGFQAGDRVVCYLDEHEPLVWFLLACAMSGVIPVPLPPAYRPESMRGLAEGCAAKAVFTLPSLVDVARHAERPVLVLASDDEPESAGTLAIRALAVPEPVAWLQTLAAQIDPTALLLIQPTSGSTGVPKLVRMTNLHYPWGARVLADTWTAERDGAEAAILVTGTMTHGAGQFSLVLALYLGGRVCIPPDVDTAVRLDHAERLEPSVMVVVPRQLRSLMDQFDTRYGDRAETIPLCGPRLRRIYTGGAVIDGSMVQRLEARGVEVLEVYGATEMCFVAFTRPGRRRAGHVGEVLPGVDIKVAPDLELLVRTPALTPGYLGDEALNRAAFDEGGYYRSGDLGLVEDGYLRLLGRKRDVLHSSEGSYVYPVVIETKLEDLPWVDQVVLLGDGKPFVIALIVLRDPPQSAEARGWLDPAHHDDEYQRARRSLDVLNKELDTFACIRGFHLFAERFPEAVYKKLAVGKVARHRSNAIEAYESWIDRLYKQGPMLSVPPSA
jgi:long-chain acyl-CoA synthetase